MMMSGMYRWSSLLALLALLVVAAPAAVRAQQVPQAFEQELMLRGMTLEQAMAQARLLGIDLDNPEQAARRAMELGIPASQVQEMLRLYREAQQQRVAPAGADVIERDWDEFDVAFEVAEPAPVEPFLDAETGLEFFGYRALRGAPDAFRPARAGLVDDSYVVGPGDELRLTLWGAAEFQHDLQVDPEGRVFIPNVGQVMVGGQELRELRRRLRGVLSARYAGLVTSPPTVNMDLSVARLRPIRIFVLGEVERPGGYTIGTGATVFQALYAVGGPALSGSLRDVRVVRNGEVVARVDLYRFLLTGSDPAQVRLRDNDHLFVPPRGKTVAIEGPLLRPAIYELLPEETLDHLLAFAGGVRPEVFAERFQIERIVPFTERREGSRAREVIDLPLDEVLRRQREVRLADGDRVSLFRISELVINHVAVEGAVFQPGRYELSPSLRTVGDLVRAADGLRPEAFTGRAQLRRLRPDRVGFDLIPIALADVVAGDAAANIALLPEDQLRVFAVDELRGEREVIIEGEVRSPGSYTWAAGMTLKDLIMQAGGLRAGAALDVAEISRMLRIENPTARAQKLEVPLASAEVRARYPYAPGDVIVELDEARTVRLEAGDRVQVRRSPAYRPQITVTIGGEVRFPGTYTLISDEETLASLIQRAGGLRPNAHAAGIRMMRVRQPQQEGRIPGDLDLEDPERTRVAVDLEALLVGERQADVRLMPGDEIFVPPQPNAVTVIGNVGHEGTFRYRPGRRVADYVRMAGGLGERTAAVYVTQPDGSTERVLRRTLLGRRGNPVVKDDAVIRVTRKEGEPPDALETAGSVIRDVASIGATALTLIVLIQRL